MTILICITALLAVAVLIQFALLAHADARVRKLDSLMTEYVTAQAAFNAKVVEYVNLTNRTSRPPVVN